MQWSPTRYSRRLYKAMLVHDRSLTSVTTYTYIFQEPQATDDVVQKGLAFSIHHY